MTEYSDEEKLKWIDRAMKLNAALRDAHYELMFLHDVWHSGLGNALPENLAEIKNGEHSAASMTKSRVAAGVFGTGETILNFVAGGVTITGIFLDPETDTPISVKTPLGHLGNIMNGSGPY